MAFITSNLKVNISKIFNQTITDDFNYTIHGTFASGKSDYISDIDLELYYGLKTLNNNNKIIFFDVLMILIENLKKNKFMLNDIICGIDDRFDIFNININRDLSFDKYDENELKKTVKEYLKKKIITKEESQKLLKFIKKNPTYMDVIGLKLLIEDEFHLIHWSLDDIKNKKINYRNKIFFFNNTIHTSYYPLVITNILEHDNNYYPVDLSILFYIGDKLPFPKFMQHQTTNFQNKIKNILITDKDRYKSNFKFYFALFKNYYQQKWMKCLKRLRTLISDTVYLNTSSINSPSNIKIFNKLTNSDKQLLKTVRFEISNLYNTQLGMYNHLKNQLSLINDLIDIIDFEKIKRLIRHLIPKMSNICCYKNIDKIKNEIIDLMKKNKIDKKKLKELLKELNKDVNELLNNMAYSHFIKIYNKLTHIYPFKFNFNKDFK